MTLEQIEEMKIPVGTPIEIKLVQGDHVSRRIGYFDRVYVDTRIYSKGIPNLQYDDGLDFQGKFKLSTSREIPIDSIKEIKILEYRAEPSRSEDELTR